MEQFVATLSRIDKGGDFVPGRQDRCPGKSAAAGWQRWTEVYLGGAWQLLITPDYVNLQEMVYYARLTLLRYLSLLETSKRS